MPSKRTPTLEESASIDMTISLGVNASGHDCDTTIDSSRSIRSPLKARAGGNSAEHAANEVGSHRLAKRKQSHQTRRRAATASHTENKKESNPEGQNKIHDLKVQTHNIRTKASKGTSSTRSADLDDCKLFLNRWLPDYQKQLQVLEERNKKRCLIAHRTSDRSPEKTSNVSESESSNFPSLSPLSPSRYVDCYTPLMKVKSKALVDYETQLSLLEKQNKARLTMVEHAKGRKMSLNQDTPNSADLGKANCRDSFDARQTNDLDSLTSPENGEKIYRSIETDSPSSAIELTRGLNDHNQPTLESSNVAGQGGIEAGHDAEAISKKSLELIIDSFPEPFCLDIPPPTNEVLLDQLRSADPERPIPPSQYTLPTTYIWQQRFSQVRSALLQQLWSRLAGKVPASSVQAAETHARALADDACRAWVEEAGRK